MAALGSGKRSVGRLMFALAVSGATAGVEMADDAVGGGEDATAGLGHDQCRVPAVGLARPSGDVREGVVLGGDAGVGAHEVGDRLRLDLDDPAAVSRRVVLAPGIVEPYVTQFVSQRLQRLSLVDVGAHADNSLREVGEPVGTAAVAALDDETRRLRLGDQRIPRTIRCLPSEQRRRGSLGQWFAAGLRHIPDVGDPPAHDVPGAKPTASTGLRSGSGREPLVASATASSGPAC